MNGTIVETAHAKVNLYLAVGGVRSDGYHEIVTFMRRISLADELTMTFSPGNTPYVDLTAEGDPTPLGADNLIVRAAYAFFERTGLACDLRVHLHKRIPSMAGLGGGSSDAAATLRGLNQWFGTPLSPDQLREVAAALGSDIPFFVTENAAISYGRGEKLLSVPVSDAPFIVVVKGKETSSTSEAYRALDGSRAVVESPLTLPSDPSDLPFRNDFEAPISVLCPSVAEHLTKLRSFGATAAMMSGSGSAVFGIFPTERSARDAAEQMGDGAFFCHMLADA